MSSVDDHLRAPADVDVSHAPSPAGFTVAIIGCGKLGSAVLQGLLTPPRGNNDTQRPLKRIVVSVRTRDRAEQVSETVLAHADHGSPPACPVEFVVGDNAAAARAADVVVLACHPHQGRPLLAAPGMRDAIPNVAAARRRSVTVVGGGGRSAEVPDPGREVLRRIGTAVHVGPDRMPAATALCASGTAFFSWFLDAIVDAAVAEGIERGEATRMAALTMAGAAELVLAGQDPAAVTARVTTPGGATARGLAVLEENETRETVVRALRATASKIRS
ncbi:hypothetical protein VTH06DRAFT_2145 [Thermothelomyces fergusii]